MTRNLLTDPQIEDAFYVHTDRGIIKFVRYGNDKLLSLVSQLTRKDSRRVRPVDLLVEISCGDSIRL